jgi:tRNA pseudouridine55 synthase
MADGLMVLAVGAKALKVVELFNVLPKEYTGEITLGAVSTTYDAEGMIEEMPLKAGWKPPDDSSTIQAIIDDRFLGKIAQVPPAFSAVHVGGTRAYRKAMQGEKVELAAREVMITECKVQSYNFPKLTLRVACGSGTYIRSLAHDLGECLRCGGYLSALTRTKVGDWSLKNAVSPQTAAWTDVLPLKDVLKPFGGIELSDVQWEELKNGRPIDGTVPDKGWLIAWHTELPVALLERSTKAEGRLKPRKVF